MASWSIDAARAGARSPQALSLALGMAIVTVAYVFALNRNVLYLGFLASGYVVVSTFVTRYPPMLACAGLLAYLAMFPAQVPKATFVAPIEKREYFNGTYSYDTPPTSGAWRYRFDLVGLEGHRRECGGTLRGNLVINGFGLDGLLLDAQGKDIATSLPRKFYRGQQLIVPIDAAASGSFVVTLRRKEGSRTRISIGTEAHESRIYSDAVWLDFRNDRCVVVYHARRRVLAAVP